MLAFMKAFIECLVSWVNRSLLSIRFGFHVEKGVGEAKKMCDTWVLTLGNFIWLKCNINTAKVIYMKPYESNSDLSSTYLSDA